MQTGSSRGARRGVKASVPSLVSSTSKPYDTASSREQKKNLMVSHQQQKRNGVPLDAVLQLHVPAINVSVPFHIN